MNAADLARLEIAKRAYTAAQPRALEVQTGVRRARLSLRRVKSRRTWFGKGLVLVVLAVGSLAYAKPHALGELVENLAHRSSGGPARRAGNGANVPAPVQTPAATSITKKRAAELGMAAAPITEETATAVATAPSLAAPPQAAAPILRDSRKPTPRAASAPAPGDGSRSAPEGASAPVKVAVLADDGAAPASKTSPAPAAVSDWGRVAQALASNDETKALAALSELAGSSDQRTRDKADLGRAQLFIAHGDSDKGCALARSLSNRRAGSHIERQAQLLLKSCTR